MEFYFSNKQNSGFRHSEYFTPADVRGSTLDAGDMRTGCEQLEGAAGFFLSWTNNIYELL